MEAEVWPAPAPHPSVILDHVTPDDRPFVLASGPGDPHLSRWSYAALEPIAEHDRLEPAMAAIRGMATFEGLPFSGGVVGYLGYDLGWAYVKKPRAVRPDPLGLPAARLGIYDAIYARDEVTGIGTLAWQSGAAARAARIRSALRSPSIAIEGGVEGELASRVSAATHGARIATLLEAIHAGEVYQANLSRVIEGRYGGAPAATFLRLLAAPPTFAAYLGLGGARAIVSASPECFFDLDGRSRAIGSYPIKGTRRRSSDEREDRRLAAELAGDEKERAEHLMIVDLLRNDLGRIAEVGSVGVDGLAYVESFPTVHHLTSRVRATLRAEIDPGALLSAIFPGGSITGAPKLRAMELIDALEGEARGVYTGAILYGTPSGSIRSSIAIRTASFADGWVRFGVGGGIVADSTSEREWDETELKAETMRRALTRR
jgi:para-aminobenzoate synthetase component I